MWEQRCGPHTAQTQSQPYKKDSTTSPQNKPIHTTEAGNTGVLNGAGTQRTQNEAIKIRPNSIVKTAHQHTEQILSKYLLSTGAIKIAPGRLNSIHPTIQKGRKGIFRHTTTQNLVALMLNRINNVVSTILYDLKNTICLINTVIQHKTCTQHAYSWSRTWLHKTCKQYAHSWSTTCYNTRPECNMFTLDQ